MGDDDAAGARVWLYEDGDWKLVADPITWGAEDSDVRAKYAEAGYSEASRQQAEPFRVPGLNSEEARFCGPSTKPSRPKRPAKGRANRGR